MEKTENDQQDALNIDTGRCSSAERAALEAEIRRLTFYDRLTSLPNRNLLHDRIEQAVASSQRSDRYGALLLMNLDRFKNINDLRGRQTGDRLLQVIAARLRTTVRASDTVARSGGDEFSVLLLELPDDAERAINLAGRLAEKIRREVTRPITAAKHGLDRDFHLSATIGIVLFRGHEEAAADLLRYADTAMHRAKQGDHGTVRFFDPVMQLALEETESLLQDLRQAATRNELTLYYQPQTDGAGRIIGAEALIRWCHPQRGLIPPNHFIPLAEENGLINSIGLWVLQTACTALACWTREIGLSTPLLEDNWQLAVNVSARQFHQGNFVEEVRRIVAATGINPQQLKLELTESLVLADLDDTISKMRALRADGIGFSLDDFGTGYSSLAQLKHLPLDQLKIDRSFIRDLETDAHDAAIVRAILAMGQAMGLSIVAEGVETKGQLAFLLSHGCRLFQGYLFSKPLPAEEFTQLLRSGRGCVPGQSRKP